MKYLWIDGYLLSRRGVTRDLQPEWNWIRYHVGGKMFAAILLDKQDQPYYINLKLEPAEGELMRQNWPDIIPGYYSDKRHWNSVKPAGNVPDSLLRHWLDRSYYLVLKGFSRKKQREILGLSSCGTDCSACTFFRNPCAGCNEACGRVFHTPDGKACRIHACCDRKHCFAICAECGQLPCEIWQSVRDPSMTDEQFRRSVAERVRTLDNLHFSFTDQASD